MKTMEVCGVTFEVYEHSKYQPTVERYERYNSSPRVSLLDCYAKPSQCKRNIYAWWRSWFEQIVDNDGVTSAVFSGVRSYNCNMFTLGGTIERYGVRYIVDITKYHNRLYKVMD